MPQKKVLRQDGRYEISVTLGRRPDGKRIRKSFYGATQKEAKAKRDAYLESLQLSDESPKMTVGKWCSTWNESYATGGVRNKANNASILKRFAEYVGENKRLSDIKPAVVQAYAKTQSNYTKSHVNKVRRTLTSLFKSAVENEMILKNPCEGVIWEGTKTGTHEMLNAYLIDLITKNWSVHPAGIWAMFMLYAGLRPSEAFALNRANISEESIKVTDGSHFEHSQLVIVKGQVKSEAGQREIPLLKPLRPVIEALPNEGLVCLSSSGMPVTEAAMRSNWIAFWNKLEDIYNGRPPRGAGRRSDRLPEDWKHLPKVQMYDLRHTFCSILYDADVDVKTAQYLMGHASLDMTLKIYTHLSEKKKARSFDKLREFFSSGSGSQTDSQE